MDPYLHRLGLYHIVIMGDCQLDKSFPKIPYNAQMDPYLHRLSLYHTVIMSDCQLDKSFLIALVER
jgi:hypothetical protein